MHKDMVQSALNRQSMEIFVLGTTTAILSVFPIWTCGPNESASMCKLLTKMTISHSHPQVILLDDGLVSSPFQAKFGRLPQHAELIFHKLDTSIQHDRRCTAVFATATQCSH